MLEQDTQRYSRHTFVWIEPGDWASILEPLAHFAGNDLVSEWVMRNRPLIVRRRRVGEESSVVPLGLPLPLVCGKRKLALSAPREAIRIVRLAPLLHEVSRSAPASWRSTIDWLLDLDPGVRVFGSLAWQHQTGLGYLHERSDLDLLWRARGRERTDTLLRGIDAIQRDAPMRIDGEVINDRGEAAQWWELRQSAQEVLVKNREGAVVMSRATFIGSSCE